MSIAIIVPYRDRGAHLAVFRPHIREYLKGIDAHIFVVEQRGDAPFNRGKLCNIGFLESPQYTHAVFHDVDMLPINADYSQATGASHIASAASQHEGRMPYREYFGGVTMFDRKSFEKINGFSNCYWGWGLEDDDLRERCKTIGVPIAFRPDGEFKSLSHPKNEWNPTDQSTTHFSQNSGSVSAINSDGLTSCSYSMVDSKAGSFTTWMLVDVGA